MTLTLVPSTPAPSSPARSSLPDSTPTAPESEQGATRRASSRGRAGARGGSAEDGMTTAEYAVGTVAACGFAAVLYKVVTSDAVSTALRTIIRTALSVPF